MTSWRNYPGLEEILFPSAQLFSFLLIISWFLQEKLKTTTSISTPAVRLPWMLCFMRNFFFSRGIINSSCSSMWIYSWCSLLRPFGHLYCHLHWRKLALKSEWGHLCLLWQWNKNRPEKAIPEQVFRLLYKWRRSSKLKTDICFSVGCSADRKHYFSSFCMTLPYWALLWIGE